MTGVARTRLITALVLTVVFTSGFALGFAVDRTAEASTAAVAEAKPDTVGETQRERRPRMYEQVGPTDAQKILLDSIVVAHRARMRALREEFREEYDAREQALIDSARESIKTVLDPAQAAHYDSLIADYERRRAEREANDAR